MKKLLSIILSILMVVTSVPLAFAAEESEYEAVIYHEYVEPDYFTSLEDAIAQADSELVTGMVVTVLKDLEFEGYSAGDRIDIESGEFTIDLAGKSLTSAAGVFFISNATVTFTDSVGTGVVDGGEGAAIQIFDSTINIYGGTFRGRRAISIDGGNVTVDGENVKVENYNESLSKVSSAISLSDATITIKNGTFVGVDDGLFLTYDGSVTNIEGGTFSGEITAHGGDLTISGGSFPQGVTVAGNKGYTLDSVLKKGYAFFGSDDKFVVVSGLTQYDEALTVKAHIHSGETQTCKGYQCVDCGNYFGEADENAHDWSNKDGVCGLCGETCEHSWGEGTLKRPVHESNPEIGSIEGYYYYICEICGDIKFELVEGADYSAYEAVSEEINGLLQSDELTPEAKQAIYSAANVCTVPYNLIASEQAIVDEVVAKLQKIIDDAEAKIASGEYVKADYTDIDETIAEIEEKLASENVTDEGKAGLEEIKEQLEAMKADYNTSEADLAELEKALEEYEAELDAGIADGTLVEVDGAEIHEFANALEDELVEKYGEEAWNELGPKINDEVLEKLGKLGDRVNALTGTVAENKEAIEEIKAELEAIIAEIEKCLNGTHSYAYEVTTPEKCESNAIETGICAVCGATDEREIEGSALEHIFLDYTSNGDATCESDGTKTAECANGCGATDTVADEGSILDHADEDGDKICDDCQAEIVDECKYCGRKVHTSMLDEFICILIMFIKLVVSFINAVK